MPLKASALKASAIEIAWAAGLFEGEGSITTHVGHGFLTNGWLVECGEAVPG